MVGVKENSPLRGVYIKSLMKWHKTWEWFQSNKRSGGKTGMWMEKGWLLSIGHNAHYDYFHIFVYVYKSVLLKCCICSFKLVAFRSARELFQHQNLCRDLKQNETAAFKRHQRITWTPKKVLFTGVAFGKWPSFHSAGQWIISLLVSWIQIWQACH